MHEASNIRLYTHKGRGAPGEDKVCLSGTAQYAKRDRIESLGASDEGYQANMRVRNIDVAASGCF